MRFSARSQKLLRNAGLVALVGATATACTLSDLLSVATGIGLQLLGVAPAADFRQTGNIRFNVLGDDPEAKANGLASLLQVSVENADGTLSDCDFAGTNVEDPSRFNTVAVLIDDSGSMERSYPQDQYGDICPTCPHDPERLRVDATRRLVETLHTKAPASRVGLYDFGPAIDDGAVAIHTLMSMAPDPDGLESALARIDGSQEAGTALWDALAEAIALTGGEAEDYQKAIWQRFGLCAHDGEYDDYDFGDDFDDATDDLDTTPVEGSADLPEGSGEGSGTATEGSGEGSGTPTEGSGEGSGTPTEGSGEVAGPDETPENPPVELDVKRYIVVLSDGEDNLSERETLESVIELAKSEDVVVHVIGLGRASVQQAIAQTNLSAAQAQALADLQRLTAETGGIYASVDDPMALEALFGQIADSLAEGYDTETYTCIPADETGDATEIPAPGDVVRGQVKLGQLSLPWTILAP
jgi:hypothetical protein